MVGLGGGGGGGGAGGQPVKERMCACRSRFLHLREDTIQKGLCCRQVYIKSQMVFSFGKLANNLEVYSMSLRH